MVSPIANSGVAPIDQPRILKTEPARKDAGNDTKIDDNAPAPVRLARLGPPIDVNHVTEIRAAIAGGNYTVDADRLAAAMLALDLPVRDA
jgi:flagellar biosynthesis anti-sigma factor FlgM